MNRLSHYLIRRIWPAAPSRRLKRNLALYARERAARQLGLNGESLVVEPAAAGFNTAICRIRDGKGRRFYLRAWPWDPLDRPSREHRIAGGLLREAGLRVPEPLFRDASFATMRRWRLEAVAEREAPGKQYDAGNPDHARLLPDIGRELAALHETTGPDWGRPWRRRNELADPRAHWAGRLAKFRERIHPGVCGMSAGEIAFGLSALDRRLGALRLPMRPSLIHGDVNPDNLIVDEQGSITWIDFGTVQYGLPEYDLAYARLRLTGEEGYGELLRGYRQYLQESRRIDEDAVFASMLLILWEKLNSRVKKTERLRNRRGDKAESDARLNAIAEDRRGIEREIIRLTKGA